MSQFHAPSKYLQEETVAEMGMNTLHLHGPSRKYIFMEDPILKTLNHWQGFFRELHISSISSCRSLVKSTGETHNIYFGLMFVVNVQLFHDKEFLQSYSSELRLDILYEKACKKGN